MKLGIIADSHDHVRNIRRALEIFGEREVETIVHAGDLVAPFAAKALAEFTGRVLAVYGNNDGEREGLAGVLDIAPPPRQFRLAGRTVVVAHEAGQVPDWMGQAADAVITGHTHEAVMPPEGSPAATLRSSSLRSTSAEGEKGEKKQPLVINPGESGGWLTGKATCAVLDLETMKAELCEIGGP